MKTSIAIIGAGNIGLAIAKGLVYSKKFNPSQITLTTRHRSNLNNIKNLGFNISVDNVKVITCSEIIIICVTPNQIPKLSNEIKNIFKNNQTIISVVSGVSIDELGTYFEYNNIIRAMPNTAISICESMTCISSKNNQSKHTKLAQKIFNLVGNTLLIHEEQMASATSLGACGIAFFLRAIRAASQGGIEIGFHSNEAFTISAQTARGAASLLKSKINHPESEIDKVTTPQGATISGLNEMEHQGFSSAMIKGIVTSAKKIDNLFDKK